MRTTILFCILLFAITASANYIGDVSVNWGDHALIAHDEHIDVTFSYKVDQAEGARFQVWPLLNGYLAPGAFWQGSPTYPQGEGFGSQYCFIGSGETLVDQIHITMWTEDFGELLLELYIPVDYTISAKGISNLWANSSEHSVLQFGTYLQFTHDVVTDEPGLMWARLGTGDDYLIHYGASGGEEILPPGGSATHFFTVYEEDQQADTIHFQFTNLDDTETLWRGTMPYRVGWGSQGIFNVSFDWEEDQVLSWGQPITCTFEYLTDDPGGVRIWAFGARDEQIIWSDLYNQGSSLLPAPYGSADRYFGYDGDLDINQIALKMTNADQTETYLTVFIPFRAGFREHAVQNVVLEPGAPAILDYEERVYTYFDYTTPGPNDLRIWNYGVAQGNYSTSTGGSPLYPPPSGSGSNFFAYDGPDPILLDQAVFTIWDEVEEAYIGYSWYPAMHFYGTSAVATHAPDESSPAATKLLANYPNPFNPKTTISFHLADPGRVQLAVFDVQGRLVKKLLDEEKLSGPHVIEWNGTDERGERVASGVYLAKFVAQEHEQTQKMILMK